MIDFRYEKLFSIRFNHNNIEINETNYGFIINIDSGTTTPFTKTVNEVSESENNFTLKEIINKTTSLFKINSFVEEVTENRKNNNEILIENHQILNESKITEEKHMDLIKYRIDTKGCKIFNWPLFDEETKPIFKNLTNEKIKCDSRQTFVEIKRFNSTAIQLDWSKLNYTPFCYISELIRGEGEDSVSFGKIF